MNWLRIAECIEAAGAIALWRPAYNASLIKLARAKVKINPNNTSMFSRFKQRWSRRQEERENKWTEKDHRWLWWGFVLLIVSSGIKIAIA